ncbi:MAG TPA: hypothetical protein VGC06_06955 [Actinomycetes bacterium]
MANPRIESYVTAYFRDGAAGRRPAVLGTRLDVADVIETIRQNRNSVEDTAAYLEVPIDRVDACLRHYADYGAEIARRLRAKGHDVAAVAERADLIGLGDEELFHRMMLEERAIMTNNVKDSCRKRVRWLGAARP